MTKVIDFLNQFIWGIPTLILVVLVGLIVSIRTDWVQIRLFPIAFRTLCGSFKKNNNNSGKSAYNALCTALAATVGTGNIAGVAGAIAIGGPGAVFWMWVCAFLGMSTKFAEVTLALCYRKASSDGGYIGGPMYIVQNGMPKRWLLIAGIYAFLGVVASFGVGSATQINALLGGLNSAIEVLGGQESKQTNILVGIIVSAFAIFSLRGGAKRIGEIATLLVPFASAFYIFICLGVLICRSAAIPAALSEIIKGAFQPSAVTGGMVGSALQTLRVGASRGVFSNEAGMGTAGIAHASAQVSHPVQQGMMGILEVFMDTIVICTMTALVILCSGINIPYGCDTGIRITAEAFTSVYGDWINIPIALSICCFAIATILGWGLYGIRCAQYLFGNNTWKIFPWLLGMSVILGAILNTGTVWALSELANGLMALPNLIILLFFSTQIVNLTHDFMKYTSR